MRAVVMAGGEGSRLRPITAHRPKPLVPVANKPIMEHIVELLVRHGYTDIVTTLHYLADEIQNTFGDGRDHGVAMTHSIEDTPLGTAGAVKQAEILLKEDTFLIISGDALTDCDLSKALAFHKEKKSLATLVLYRVPAPLEFGIVITDDEGRVQRFLEKPGWGEVFTDTVNTGIYILEPEIFDWMEKGQNVDWSKDVFPALLAAGAPLYGYVMNEYWCDVGTLEQYREAQAHVLQGRTQLTIPGEMVKPGVWVGQNTIIDDSAELIAPICIGSNCRVKRGAKLGPFSVIGDSCLVEDSAVVNRSVLWDRCYVGIDVDIQGATVGSRVTMKRDVKIGEDAVIGDRTLIDVGSTIRPRVKVWPDKIIERGSTVTMSLVTGSRWRGNLFRDLGVAGISNIEITPEFATRFAMAYGSTLPLNSKVIAVRDSSRSSRMIKRSAMASLLSSGCRVIDLHGAPVPVVRHHVRLMGAAGAINVRKSPGNKRLTLMEVFDHSGAYLPKAMERKIEASFFREDFHRADPDELGRIEEAIQPIEAYTRDFLAHLPEVDNQHRLKVVVDYGYSSVSPIFPAILDEVGVESISLNSFNDAKQAPRRLEEFQEHLDRLSQIVPSVGYDFGVLVINEGENLYVVDDQGHVLSGNRLFATLCVLLAETRGSAKIAMSVTAPHRLEDLLVRKGASVHRCRSGTRDLMSAALAEAVTFAGNEQGGFIFQAFHPGFDAMFTLANLVRMLQQVGGKLSEFGHSLPEFHLAYEMTECPWENKGTVMRRLSEDIREGSRIELVDGIKIYDDDSWVLVLPDSFEPVFHVFAESPEASASHALVKEYVAKIDLLRIGR
ncbi:MAG: sugar phosphate nucleotidyltransferase [Fimbriimonadaceae bacterium]|jgi:mannose-1-phosphate guanylyltransferase/phosphomannomutase|nr:sugar phosphate nucleotidyltransferase [Fimbriimonadaceae bacterium]